MNIDESYKQYYTPSKFTQKIKTLFQKDSDSTLIRSAVTLYVILNDESVPYASKGLIVASLSYLVVPFDAVPDMLVVFGGLLDDAAVIATTLAHIQIYNTEAVQERVDEILNKWKVVRT